MLAELVPHESADERGASLTFNLQHLRIDARAQALVMLLRHSLRNGSIEPLEAEGLSLTLVSRAVGPRTARASRAPPTHAGGWWTASRCCWPAICRGAGRWPRSPRKSAARRCI